MVAYAKCDLGKALKTSRLLPAFTPPTDLDVDSLEAASWAGRTFKARPGQTPRAGGEKTPKAKDDEGLQARKKATKKRKKRLPKEGWVAGAESGFFILVDLFLQ